MALSSKLKQLREVKGVSVREAAKRLGFSFSMLARIESGLAYPSSKRLVAMAELYGFSLLELQAEEAVDRGRIEVPAGVAPDDVREALYRLAGQAAPTTKAVDRHAFVCPHCGKACKATQG